MRHRRDVASPPSLAMISRWLDGRFLSGPPESGCPPNLIPRYCSCIKHHCRPDVRQIVVSRVVSSCSPLLSPWRRCCGYRYSSPESTCILSCVRSTNTLLGQGHVVGVHESWPRGAMSSPVGVGVHFLVETVVSLSGNCLYF